MLKSLTKDEFVELLERHKGHTVEEILEELLPGFCSWYKDKGVHLLCAHCETPNTATEILSIYTTWLTLPLDVLTLTKELVMLSVALGWYMREVKDQPGIEGTVPKTPEGVTVH